MTNNTEEPWDIVSDPDDKFILQLKLREAGTMLIMHSSNLASKDADVDKIYKTCKELIQKTLDKI